MTVHEVVDIGLLACSRTKLDRSAPARELYCSPLFRAARAYAEQRYGAGRWLSARHGVVEPDALLEPYDLALQSLGANDRRHWSERVAADLARRFPPSTIYWLHAGALYRKALARAFANSRAPLAGLRIGQQLAWYRNAIDCPISADAGDAGLRAVENQTRWRAAS
jgi:hypothetical protein